MPNTGVEVILEQGSATEVEVEVDDNLMEHIVTRVEMELNCKIDETYQHRGKCKLCKNQNYHQGLESSSDCNYSFKSTLKVNYLTVKWWSYN